MEPLKGAFRVAPTAEKSAFSREFAGGGERTRTADFHVANVALYQLSYTPKDARTTGRTSEVVT